VIQGRSKVGYVRKTAAIVLAAAFVVAIAGCSDLPQTVVNCTPAATAGSASKSISASGEFGKDPKAKIPTPTVTKKVQISTVRQGTGAVLGADDFARLQYTIYAGDSGSVLGSSGQSGFTKATEYQAGIGVKADPIGRYLTCERVGSRTAMVLTAQQFFGSASAATSEGVTAKQVLVVVSDIVSGYRGRATGPLQPLQSGFPSVVTAPDGTPGVTFDLQSPPKDLRYEVVRRGNGAKVKKGDTLLLQVEGIQWTNPAPTDTFVSTWTAHQPEVTPAASITQNSNSTLDPGSSKALIGQTVGSQVLVVVPPKFGYPSGKAPQGFPTSGTLVFVYDILGSE
jgi:FKBP-type peptidyl-prolyl cis-trans isomerase